MHIIPSTKVRNDPISQWIHILTRNVCTFLWHWCSRCVPCDTARSAGSYTTTHTTHCSV